MYDLYYDSHCLTEVLIMSASSVASATSPSIAAIATISAATTATADDKEHAMMTDLGTIGKQLSNNDDIGSLPTDIVWIIYYSLWLL